MDVITQVDIPAYFFTGRYDYTYPFVLNEQYFSRVHAPDPFQCQSCFILTGEAEGLYFWAYRRLTCLRTCLRPAETLTESINHRVNLYSAAAVAAGVSMLAMAQPADAEVVVTKATLPITHLASVSLDLNKDGIADFHFSLYTFAYHSFFADLTVQALTGGEVVASPGSRGAYASALVRGAKSGPSAHFSSDNGLPRLNALTARLSARPSTLGTHTASGGQPAQPFSRREVPD